MAELDPKVYNSDPNQMINAARGVVGLQSDKFELAKKKLQVMQTMFGSLMAKPDLSASDVHDVAAKLVAQGIVSAKEAAIELGNMPNTREGLRSWTTQHTMQVLSAQERLNAAYGGPPQYLNNGSHQIPVTGSQIPGTPGYGMRQVGPAIGNNLTPQDVYKQEQIGQTGSQPEMGTHGQYIQGVTGAPPPGYSTQGGPAPQPPPQQQPQMRPVGANGYPVRPPLRPPMPQAQPTPVMPNAVPTVQAPPIARGDHGGVLFGQPLGQPEAAHGEGAAQGEMIGEMGKAVNTSAQRKNLLEDLNGLVERFSSGPGATDWNKVKAGINTNLPLPKGWEIFDPKSIGDQEKFRKSAESLAQQQFQALGGTGTDAKLSSAGRTSPSEELSKMGNKEIIAMLRGNEDALAVKSQEWEKWRGSHGPETFSAFNNDFNKRYSPKVFQFQYMKPQERASMWKSMDENERNKLVQDLDTAEEKKWIEPLKVTVKKTVPIER